MNRPRGSFDNWAERLRVFTHLSAILKDYQFNPEKGICINPGQHEGNTIATIYFTEQVISGFGDGTYGLTSICHATTVECEVLGASRDFTWFELTETEDGFVFGQWISNSRVGKIEDSFMMEEGL